MLGLAYARLGFDAACGQDEVFKALVLARLIEPTSKLDTIRVLVHCRRSDPRPALPARRMAPHPSG